jgi:hypothetical protein
VQWPAGWRLLAGGGSLGYCAGTMEQLPTELPVLKTDAAFAAGDERAPGVEVERLADLSAAQWKSGAAAWLGWLFDGLDMHLYTLVALPFVATLLETTPSDPRVGRYSAYIQAAFLFGWAIGGGFFGRIGDRLGRSRALVLTILTYAIFTACRSSRRRGGTC